METIITPRAPPIKYPRRTAARYFGLVSSPLMPGRTQQLQYDMNFMLPCSQNFFEFGQGYFTTYYLRFQYIAEQYVIKAQINLFWTANAQKHRAFAALRQMFCHITGCKSTAENIY